jgi:hypothetical protein
MTDTNTKAIKLSEQLLPDHVGGDFGKALDGYSERDAELEAELEITNNLLDTRNAVLSKIPECSVHGFCFPHFADWIESAKKLEAENAEIRAKLEAYRQSEYRMLTR